MYLKTRFFQIIVITTAIVQCRAEDGKQPVLGLSGSTFPQRSSKGLNVVRKKEQDTSLNHIRKRTLEVVTTRLFDVATKAFGVDDECSFPSEKKFVASDGSDYDFFGASCSMPDDLVVIGAPFVYDKKGAAYVFNLDGTEVAKLTPGNDEEDYDFFGISVAMDEKVAVGTWKEIGGYVQVFSRNGTYERTLTCDECFEFGRFVATHGNLIVMGGEQNSTSKLFLYTKEGEFIKSLEHEDSISDLAISEQFIASTAQDGKTFIYSNTSPDFPDIAQINQGGSSIAVSNERLVIGDWSANGYDGVAWLYETNGALVKTLDRQDASSGSWFGRSVAITDDKVLVGAVYDDDQGGDAGSIFIYSAVTGEFIEKVAAPDGEAEAEFGMSVCASDSHYMVGATGDDTNTGAAYLFQLPEE